MNTPLTPLRCLHRAIDLFAGKIGVICGKEQFTYGEFGERCQRLATGLAANGVHPGDRVAYLSLNNHMLLEGYFGVVQAGAILLPLNVRLSPAELAGILNDSGARFRISATSGRVNSTGRSFPSCRSSRTFVPERKT
jgi:fatty-acyl-CoA synthase